MLALFLGTATAGSVPPKHQECKERAEIFGDGAFGAFQGMPRDPSNPEFDKLSPETKAYVLKIGQQGYDTVIAVKPTTKEEVLEMIYTYYDLCLISKDI
jgi:hypothetical protein